MYFGGGGHLGVGGGGWEMGRTRSVGFPRSDRLGGLGLRVLRQDLKASKAKVLVNLASQEKENPGKKKEEEKRGG